MSEHPRPEVDRMVREAMRNGGMPAGTVPQQLTAAAVWGRCGACPKCGAPIWFCAAAPATDQPPQASYTCVCALLEAKRAERELREMLEVEKAAEK